MKFNTIILNITFLFFGFFMRINATETIVVSLEEFLINFGKTFREEAFNFTPLDREPSENLVIVQLKAYSTTGTASIPELIQLMSGGTGELVRTILVDDPNHLLMQDGVFLPAIPETKERESSSIRMHKASSGSHPVGIYEYLDNKLCFKQGPEAPNIEIATHSAFKGIFGTNNENTPIPPAEVIVMNGIPFLVSQFRGDESFDDILMQAQSPAREYIFDLEEFQRLAIFCLLTVPEDCRPRNCRVRTIPGSSKSGFVLIDNERSFGKEFTESYPHSKWGNIHTRCHCVLFYFDELLSHKIKESVIDEIMKKKDDILTMWTRILKEDSYQLALTKHIEERDGEKTFLGIPFDEAITKSMLTRVNSFIKLIRSNREQSLANIFRTVAPELAEIYRIQVPEVPIEGPVDATNLAVILMRLNERDPGSVPGRTAPPSAYTPRELYMGSTNINLEAVLKVMKWVRDDCDVLDERERNDTNNIVAALELFLVMKSAPQGTDQINTLLSLFK